MRNRLEIGHSAGKIELRSVQLRTFPEVFVLYVSDLHFNRFSGRRAEQLADIFTTLKPDLLLWGGDYADTRTGLAPLREVLAAVPAPVQMLAVAGNHDYAFGLSKIRALMEQHGVRWIEKTWAIANVKGMVARVDGNHVPEKTGTDDLNILCNHRPIFPRGTEKHYDLALAGHLHGSQFVFWQKGHALYPGRWFYPWNVLEKQVGRCRYVISRGIGDTLPVRYNCPREVILALW